MRLLRAGENALARPPGLFRIAQADQAERTK